MRNEFNIQPEVFEFEQLKTGFDEFEDAFGEQGTLEGEGPDTAYIRWLQTALNRVLGLTLAVDGIMGPQTRSAIRTFQQRQGLQVDGTPGPQTERALVAAGAPAPPMRVITLPPVVIVAAAARLDQFDFDRSNLKPAHIQAIDALATRVAASWQTRTPIRTIRVVGHTDPEGPANYNLGLGQRRALAVRRELMSALDRKQQHLSQRVLVLASSKGESEPIDVTRTSQGQARNRRVEIFVSTRALQPIRPPAPRPPVVPPTPPDTPLPPTPTPPVVPPPPSGPTCNREELNRLVNQCVEDTRRCTIEAGQNLALALGVCAATGGSPVCTAAAAGKFLLELRRCREALERCDAAAKRATNCQ